MKISRITAWSVHVPLKKAYALAGGTQVYDGVESTMIRIDTDEGISGWGESCPWGSTYLPAHAPGVRAGLETIGPALIGADPRGLDHINRLMDVTLPGHPYVKSGLDTAWWDINRAWMPATAVQVLNATATAQWVEQPSASLRQCAHVAARVRNPIMLDKCMHSFDDHLEAWSKQACEGVKVKPNRVGGLTRARQIRDFGVSVGWRMHIEDLGGCGLANMAAVHLASATPTANRLASWVGDDLIGEDFCKGTGARAQDGHATPHGTPGHGVVPDMDRLGDPVGVFQ